MPRQRSDDDLRLNTSDHGEVDGAPASELYAGLRPVRWHFAWLRLGIPVLAACALLLVLLSDAQDIDDDLQLIAPAQAIPGQSMPLRALLYGNLRGIEGPRLLQTAVQVELRAGNKVLSRTWLHTAHSANPATADMEGALQIPASAVGHAQLHASAQLSDSHLTVDAPLALARGALTVPAQGRALRELQQFSEGPLQLMGEGVPSALRTRVAGGACVPELPCSLLVYVGEPAASVWAEANSAVTPSARASQPSPVTTGVVALEVVTHGPEAELWLRVSRAGQLIARRSVRLPIAMASDVLQPADSVWPPGGAAVVHLAGASGGCLVDAFLLDATARGAWLRTGSLAHCAGGSTLPWAALPAGIVRLQARTDPFSTDTSAVRVAYVRTPDESDEQLLSRLAARARTVDAADPCVLDVLAQPARFAGAAFAPTTRYLAALLEIGLMAPPRPVSGYPQALARLRATQSRMRALALCGLGLCALALALAVGRRGLTASARASQILVHAGQGAEQNRRSQLRGQLAVIASVLALLLVFVVVGLYIVARGFLH